MSWNAIMPIRETPDRGRQPSLWADEAGWITVAPDPDCWLCKAGLCQQRVRVNSIHPIRIFHSMAGQS